MTPPEGRAGAPEGSATLAVAMTRRPIAALVLLVALACDPKGSAPSPAPLATTGAPSSVASAPLSTPSATVTAPAGSAVSLAGGGNGWLATPATPGKHGAVLVLQEWWGMNDWIKQDVARFASQGYVALAVDLYRGKVATDAGEAHELMRGLPDERAMADMRAGFDLLAARPDVDVKHVGIVGWCMGGGYALAYTAAEPRLAAAAINYGKLVTDPAKVHAIHAAVLGNFAGADRGIDPKDVKAFADALAADHKDSDVKVYGTAKHAFMNPNNAEGYDDAAAKDAWARIDGWFAKKLAPAP
jgi:carboxymethylenebutenolidase